MNDQQPTAGQPLPPPDTGRARGIISDVGIVILGAVLTAIFVINGPVAGVVCTVIVLLIVIAVKVSHIAKAAKR